MRLARTALWSLVLLGCGGGGADGDADASLEPDAAAAPVFGDSRVSFRVAEVDFSDGQDVVRSSLFSGIAFAAEPTSFHDETMQQGSCRLLSYAPQICTPFCDGICLAGNVCESFPTFASIGQVSLSGLKVTAGVVEFNGRYSFDSQVGEDIFDSGDAISIAAAGGPGGPLRLTAAAPTPLDLSVSTAFTLVDGQDNVVEWSEGSAGERVRLVLRSTNAAHGQPLNAIIECDAPDTGSLVIPQAMIEAFPPAAGSTICASVDCPPSELLRYRRDEIAYQGSRAELIVAAQRSFPLIH